MPRLDDFRLAVRNLSRVPGFALAAIATLALGIGASTTVFSVVYGVLLRPLPYPDAGSIVVIQGEKQFPSGTRFMNFGAPELEEFRAIFQASEAMGMFGGGGGVQRTPAGVEPSRSVIVSGGFFQTLGLPMRLGRPIADDVEPVVVISHRLWQRAYAGAPDVLGRTLVLSDRPYTIVGVAPPELGYPDVLTDVYRPLAHALAVGDPSYGSNRNSASFRVIARLKPGRTLAAAQADAERVMTALAPQFDTGRRDSRVVVTPLPVLAAGTAAPALRLMMAAVSLVLLIACANVVNLILARQLSRAREVAVRLALGASRSQLVGQLLAESATLATVGGVLGAGVAVAGIALLKIAPPPQLPRLDDIQVDAPVLAFAAAISTLATLVAGLIPAIAGTRADISLALKARTQGSSAGARRVRLVLVVAEIAVAIVLVVGAALLVRSVVRLLKTDIGVSTEQVIAAQLDISQGNNSSSPRQVEIADALAARLRAMPGVLDAGYGTGLPPAGEYMRFSFNMVTAANPDGVQHMMTVVPAGPGFFSTLQVRLLRGRLFSAIDGKGAAPVVILNREAAARLFGAGDPIGRTLPMGNTDEQRKAGVTIVGVVDNVKFSGVATPPEGVIFRPFAQNSFRILILFAKTAGDPAAIAAGMRAMIREVDPDIHIFALQPLAGFVSQSIAQPRFRAALLFSFAAISLTLAAIGLYGVIAYSVSQRTTEIGVRVALGARAADVMRLVFAEGGRLAAAGLALGLAGAFALRQTLAGFIYGVQVSDPLSFALGGAGLALAAAMACYLPARRAARVDPVVALRAD